MDNEKAINQWASFPIMLKGKRILLSTDQDPDRIFEATWEATSPNGKHARLAEPMQKIGKWYLINEFTLRDVLE